MASCLLCLEINNGILDCIESGSIKWNELNVTKIIEKHFWSLNNIQPRRWICLSCWREVEDFHKFYLRIEEAHLHFGEFKLENLASTCKEDIPIEKIIKDDSQAEKDKTEFCFMEPEILIDQTQQKDFLETEIHQAHNTLHDKDVEHRIIRCESSDDLDDVPLIQAFKRLRLKRNVSIKDPLEKSPKCKRNKNSKSKLYSGHKATGNVKKEPLDLNDVSSDSDSTNENDVSNANFAEEKYSSETLGSKKNKVYINNRKSQKENDKFIAENFKQMFCDLCQVPFENFPAMQKHFTNYHEERGYVVCCKKKFFSRSCLVDHLQCHINPDNFKCKECGKSMSDRSCFDDHMLRVHGTTEVIKKHSCDICGKSFTKPSVLSKHKLSHLPEKDKKFPCGDCGKNYGSSYLLNQHKQAVHLRRFIKVCHVCGKSSNSSTEFKIHMNKHEGIPMPDINCDVCGLRLSTERGLKIHKETQHPVGGKQEHHCPLCAKVSPTLKALKKHINTMHKNGHDHKCSICDKAFKRAEALREHVATHTGKALYTCPWCPKTFNSNGNMHAHRKKIHPKEWVESKLQKYSKRIFPAT